MENKIMSKKEKIKLDEVLEKESMNQYLIYLILDIMVFSIVFLTSINLIKDIADNKTQIVLLILLMMILPKLIRSSEKPKLIYRDVRYED